MVQAAASRLAEEASDTVDSLDQCLPLPSSAGAAIVELLSPVHALRHLPPAVVA